MPLFQLNDQLVFPSPSLAEPDGLLAVGGDLSPERLMLAYNQGIFPWYDLYDPILWWSPDPRMVLFPEEVRITKSMAGVLRNRGFTYSMDRAFEKVIHYCKHITRSGQPGTWITDEMEAAYTRLHKLGAAHSIEVWDGKELAGGLYGLATGTSFSGESMFALKSNASKAGLIVLCKNLVEWGFDMLDCQVPTAHLKRMGAVKITRDEYLARLKKAVKKSPSAKAWQKLAIPPV